MKWVETKMVTFWLRDRSSRSSQNSIPRQRIDPGGRFVEDEHFGLVHDRDRERKPLPDAERQLRGELIEISGQGRKRRTSSAMRDFALSCGR